MTGFFETLVRPDQEELDNLERREVGRAANILQVGEFQLLQLAYREWHGKDLPESLVDRLFHGYMIHNEVPHWARHYARQILRLDEQGRVDDQEGRYHRYDYDFQHPAPHGFKKFAIATGIVCLLFGSALLGAVMTANHSATQFPPYVEEEDLRATPDEITQQAIRPTAQPTDRGRGTNPGP